MRKHLMVMMLMVFCVAAAPAVFAQSSSSGYNFGYHKSSTLTTKAWQALADKNVEAVLAYVNKCVELYDAQALKMQAELSDYPAGSDQKIFSYWALNDVATSYFILGSAYLNAGNTDQAKVSFQKVVKNYSFGQCYDAGQKFFWKPALAAQEKLDQMAKGK